MVYKEDIINCNANFIHIKAGSSIDIREPNAYKETDLQEYQQLIKKLIYLTYSIRLDIAFNIGQFSKHIINSRKRYLQSAKKVVRYLKRIIEMGLIFGQEINSKSLALYRLIEYGDSNFAREPEDKKSVMGYYFFLNRAIVS